MKTIYSKIALLLFSLIFFSNYGCKISTDPTSPSSDNNNGWYVTTLNISGIVTDRNNKPVDTASVKIWSFKDTGTYYPEIQQLENTKTNERGEYSFNTKIVMKWSPNSVPPLYIRAEDYTTNDSGETDYWFIEKQIEVKEPPQVINLQLTYHY